MPARGERPRASRGHTHDPWPCCGAQPDSRRYGRPKEGICAACTDLIRRGKEARAEEAQRTNLSLFRWWERSYAVPVGFYLAHEDAASRDVREALTAAVYALGSLLVEGHEPEAWRRPEGRAAAFVLTPDKGDSTRDWQITVRMRADVQAAFAQLVQAVQAYGRNAHAAGQSYGRSLWTQLANGEITTKDFNARSEEKQRS